MIPKYELTIKELLKIAINDSNTFIIEFRNQGKQIAMMHSDSPLINYFENLFVADWFVTNDTENTVCYIELYIE